MSTEISQLPVPTDFRPGTALFGGLSRMESAFVDHYLADPKGNAAEAARKAGYKDSTSSGSDALYITGSRLLRRPKVQNEIARRLGTSVASSTEVLELLTKHARGDLTDILDKDGNFDFKAARHKRLLKKLKVKTRHEKDEDGNLTPIIEQEFEIHDPQSALEKLGRFHKLFSEQTPNVQINLTIERTELTCVLQQALEVES